MFLDSVLTSFLNSQVVKFVCSDFVWNVCRKINTHFYPSFSYQRYSLRISRRERLGGESGHGPSVLLSPAICVTFLPPDKSSHSLSSLEFLSSKTLTQDRGVRCKVTSYLSGCHVVVVVVVHRRDRQALHQLLHPHRDDIQVRRESAAGVHVKHALVPLHLGHSRSDH